jgi:hypothetical protein
MLSDVVTCLSIIWSINVSEAGGFGQKTTGVGRVMVFNSTEAIVNAARTFHETFPTILH